MEDKELADVLKNYQKIFKLARNHAKCCQVFSKELMEALE